MLCALNGFRGAKELGVFESPFDGRTMAGPAEKRHTDTEKKPFSLLDIVLGDSFGKTKEVIRKEASSPNWTIRPEDRTSTTIKLLNLPGI